MTRPILTVFVLLLQNPLAFAWLNAVRLSSPWSSNKNKSLIKNSNNDPSTSSTGSIPPNYKNVRLLILPGFGNDSTDYYLSKQPQGSLVESLRKRGWSEDQIRVLPLQRSDWLQVFLKGVLDLSFWQGNMAPTRPAFGWYLARVAQQIKELCNSEPTTDETPIQVVLVCHSAGGWLARAALGFNSRNETTSSPESMIDLKSVLGVVTLGSPHIPPPPEAMDMTRGALRITDQLFPGVYHSNGNNNDKSNLFYISVMGEAIKGVKQQRKKPWEPTTITGFAYTSYEAVCGEGNVTGDGVVPLRSGHITGATQLNLQSVFHSINAPDQWYGSDGIIDSWHGVMLQQIYTKLAKPTRNNNPLKRLFQQ